ncbi:MAG: hypothetical protein GWN01_15100, partial [Nitrosopumilaceae archaeon]|nr:hypothetical protein [Nitrosopumilaceae archaeon]NIV66791.1 hypothetical protein [Nitrosopumilaceae archaeon]NIX62774.1 hypothetical protein [Nitrosopumilaceae archaeon]
DATANVVASGFVTSTTANTFTMEKTSGDVIGENEITLNSNAVFIAGETIEEESSIELTLDSLTGTFNVGEQITQVDQNANGVYFDVAYGRIETANTTS